MPKCFKTDDDTYNLEGLTLNQIEMIQEGIIRLFNESNRDEHRAFRGEVIELNAAIDPVLEKQMRNQYLIPFDK